MEAKPVSFLTLQRKLTQLKDDTEIHNLPGHIKTLGAGVQKAGHLFVTNTGTRWVVKRGQFIYGNNRTNRPPNLRKYGCSSIIQFKAGRYIIQEYTVTLGTLPYNHPAWETFKRIHQARRNYKIDGDFHEWNFGVSQNGSGRLVCYDW